MKPRHRWGLFAALVLSSTSVHAEAGLAQRLVSKDSGVREEAMREFGELPPTTKERFVPNLMVAMSSDDPGIRLDAARVLRAMGISADKTAHDLRKEVPKKGESSRLTAYREVQAAKKEDFPDLRHALDEEKRFPGTFGENEEVREKRLGFDRALIDSLRDPDPLVRAHAARQLSQLHPVPLEALPQLTDLLRDKETEVRASAAAAIAGMGPSARSAIPALMSLAGDPEPGVRAVAADALDQLQRPH